MLKNLEAYKRVSQVPETVLTLARAHGMPVPVSVIMADFEARGKANLTYRLCTYLRFIRRVMDGKIVTVKNGKKVESYALENWDEFILEGEHAGWPLPKEERAAIRAARNAEVPTPTPPDVQPLVSDADPTSLEVFGGAHEPAETGLTVADSVGAIDVAAMSAETVETSAETTDEPSTEVVEHPVETRQRDAHGHFTKRAAA